MSLAKLFIMPDRIPCGGAGQFGAFGVSVSSRQVLFVNQYREARPLVFANHGLGLEKTALTR